MPQMDSLKLKYMSKTYVPFHVTDMIRRRKSFGFLRNPSVRDVFTSELRNMLLNIDHTVVCALIDKKSLIDKYTDGAREPYRFAMQIILERFVLFLAHKEAIGKVIAESRNTGVDYALNQTFQYYWSRESAKTNTKTISFKSVISSKNIKFYKKAKGIQGIEIADLYAYSLKAWGITNYPNPNKAYPLLRNPADMLLELCLSKKIRRIAGGFIKCGYKMWPPPPAPRPVAPRQVV